MEKGSVFTDKPNKEGIRIFTITIKSDKPMVIIPMEEYENMKEPIELLTENPNLLQELKKEREEIEKGNYISFEDFNKKIQPE